MVHVIPSGKDKKVPVRIINTKRLNFKVNYQLDFIFGGGVPLMLMLQIMTPFMQHVELWRLKAALVKDSQLLSGKRTGDRKEGEM